MSLYLDFSSEERSKRQRKAIIYITGLWLLLLGGTAILSVIAQNGITFWVSIASVIFPAIAVYSVITLSPRLFEFVEKSYGVLMVAALFAIFVLIFFVQVLGPEGTNGPLVMSLYFVFFFMMYGCGPTSLILSSSFSVNTR